MTAPHLVRTTSHGVTLIGDTHRPDGVTFAFFERTGGVSEGCYASLNLGEDCGDEFERVKQNRHRAMDALGMIAYADNLVVPKQVHGDRVIVVGGVGMSVADAQQAAREGADAIVCVAPHIPVLLCYADCVPIVLTVPGGFAVVHSGWKGTLARIGAKALHTLVEAAGCMPSDVKCYVGPHIGSDDYEVSQELIDTFAREFGSGVCVGKHCLDLAAAIRYDLREAGAREEAMVGVMESTASCEDRFFSYRASRGRCGRHGALACMGVGEPTEPGRDGSLLDQGGRLDG